mmetsp:Transcript_12652/g.21817  ORF Transcript_12652/g.21817 Transcript_12652/m.21817 type:complete len:146 (-) Transcript_12652:67-504(-)|eukprot:CAMPEP_0183739056 /NCGR_PEP_ID=MMETSP0737-20130205/56109_1 /TAXON_ID=385413 /ORGANISM="Thalassiosira miniscula, Strain CCMP1093" /LENGTH=145 /DNA_ID=CAMNT_0025973743 /DNA_START=105 /DNA_END=542 /DNA_ORIENTATION=-
MISTFLSIIVFIVVTPSLVVTVLVRSPSGKRMQQKAKDRMSNWRSQFWNYAVETASEFLASVLTHPSVQPLIVNAITTAIDLWVSQNSEEVKDNAMAMRNMAMDNVMALPGKVGGKVRETAVQIGGKMAGGTDSNNEGEPKMKRV